MILQAHADTAVEIAPRIRFPDSHTADRELQRRIRTFLEQMHIPSSQLRVDVKNGVVTLRGSHRSFYHKQLCINCCQRVAGVVELIDSTKVVPRS
jgi:osmotically-inducible protein OsmY